MAFFVILKNILLKSLKYLSILLLLLVLSLVAILSIESGRIFLLQQGINQANQFLPNEAENKLSIQQVDIEHFTFSQLKINRIEINDQQGTWLTLNKLHFKYQLKKLFDDLLELPLIEFGEIKLQRLPDAIEENLIAMQAEKQEKQETKSQVLPQLPLKIYLSQVALKRLHIQPEAWKQIGKIAKIDQQLWLKNKANIQQLATKFELDLHINSFSDYHLNASLVRLAIGEERKENKFSDALLEIKAKSLEKALLLDYKINASQLFFDENKLSALDISGNIKLDNLLSDPKNLAINFSSLGKIKQLKLKSSKGLKPQQLSWKIDLKHQHDLLTINKANIDSQWLKSDITGLFNLKHSQGDFSLKTQIADLAKFDKQFTSALLAPNITFAGDKKTKLFLDSNIKINSNLTSIVVLLKGQLSHLNLLDPKLNSPYQGLLGPELNWKAEVLVYENNNKLKLSNVSINGQGTELSGEGLIDLQSQRLDLNWHHAIENLSVVDNFSGSLKQRLNITGTLKAPIINLQSQVDRFVFEQYQLESIKLVSQINLGDKLKGDVALNLKQNLEQLDLKSNFNLNEDILSLSKLSLAIAKQEKSELISTGNQVKDVAANLTANLNVNLSQQKINGDIKGYVTSLKKLHFLHKSDELSGESQFSLQLRSTGANEQVAKIKLDAKQFGFKQWQAKKLNIDGEFIETGIEKKQKISFNAHLDKLEDASLSSTLIDNITVQGQGGLNKLNIQLLAKQLVDIHKLSLKADINNISAQEHGKSKAYKHLLLQQLNGELNNKGFALKQAADIKFFNEKQWSLSGFDWHWGDTALSIDAKAKEDNIDAKVRLDNFMLSSLKLIDKSNLALADLSGLAQLDIDVNGSLTKPKLSLILDGKDIYLKSDAAKNLPKSHLNLSAQYKNNQMMINLKGEGFSKGDAAIPISAQLSMPLQLALQPFKLSGVGKELEKTNINGSLQADIDLEQIQTWLVLDQQLIKGQFKTDLNFSGTLSKPEIAGNLLLDKGYYENGLTGTQLKDINFNLALEKEQITIQKFIARDLEKGFIKATGEFSLNDKANYPYQMQFDLSHIQLAKTDELNIVVDGQTKIKGNKLAGGVKGDLIVEKGQFILPENIPADVPELEITEIKSKTENTSDENNQEKKPAYPMDLDIKLKVRPQFYVRGRGLESQWEGNVNVTGNTQEPAVIGNLGIKRGHINFLSKRFDFRKGQINFYGGLPIKPQLDFEFAAKGADMLAILNLSGPAQKPVFSLSSEPTLPQDEVLSKLLFGKDAQSISALQAIQLVSALKTLTTGGSGTMDKTRNSLGFDTLDVNGGNGDSSGSVKAGKHINDKVYVEVEQSLGDGGSTVRVEMEMTDHISIESRVDQESNTGVGVSWKYDY